MNSIFSSKKYLLVLVFFASIIFSIVFLFFFKNLGPSEHKVPGSDYTYLYEPVAENILAGKGITIEGRVPTNIGLGYPVFLSGVFFLSQKTGIDRLDLVVVFNVVFGAFVAVFLLLLAKEIFGGKIGLICSFLWMTYPFNLWFLKNPNTENPFLALLFAGFWLLFLALKKKSLNFIFLAGFLLGLASFMRIIGLFLPIFLAFLLFFLLSAPLKKKLFFASIFLLGNLIAISPWMFYTFSKSGGFIPISQQGPAAIVVGITWLTTPGASSVLPEDVAALVGRVQAADLNTFSKLSAFLGNELISRPSPLLKLAGLKIVRPWYATSTRWYEMKILAVQLFYLLSGVLGIAAIMKFAKDKKREMFLALFIILYFWLMAFLNVSILRYLVPVMSLIMIFAAVFVDFVIERYLHHSN